MNLGRPHSIQGKNPLSPSLLTRDVLQWVYSNFHVYLLSCIYFCMFGSQIYNIRLCNADDTAITEAWQKNWTLLKFNQKENCWKCLLWPKLSLALYSNLQNIFRLVLGLLLYSLLHSMVHKSKKSKNTNKMVHLHRLYKCNFSLRGINNKIIQLTLQFIITQEVQNWLHFIFTYTLKTIFSSILKFHKF